MSLLIQKAQQNKDLKTDIILFCKKPKKEKEKKENKRKKSATSRFA
jgi:hypothetical protein